MARSNYDVNSMELAWNILINAVDTFGRKEAYQKMVKIYNNNVIVRRDWKHYPDEHRYVDRFVRIRVVAKLKKQENAEKHDNFPCYGGLYLLGMITVDDNDLDTNLYWVKTGRAAHFCDRFRDYNTHNPHYKCFDTMRIDNDTKRKTLEKSAHNVLEKVGIAHCINNDEWFLVSKETYFDIKNYRFNFFFE